MVSGDDFQISQSFNVMPSLRASSKSDQVRKKERNNAQGQHTHFRMHNFDNFYNAPQKLRGKRTPRRIVYLLNLMSNRPTQS